LYLKGGGVKSEKYRWVDNLSDDDIEWMLALPYTIRIPHDSVQNLSDPNDRSNSRDTIIVHPGFIPQLDLVKQIIETMIVISDVAIAATDGITIKTCY
jgi:hypothetical protein